MSTGSVVVIGGGIIGLCTADELTRRGYTVTVIERDGSPGSGCSYGNGGLIVPSHFEPLAAPGMIQMGLRMMPNPQSPFGIDGFPNLEVLSWMARFAMSATKAHVERAAPVLRDMNLASRRIYADTYKDVSEIAGFEHKGELMICRTEAKLDGEKHLAEKAAALGMKTRVLSKADLQAEEPEMEIDALGAVYFEDDAKVSPAAFMTALRKRLALAGCQILDGQDVLGFETDGRVVRSVRIPGRSVEGDQFVLAAGSWSGILAKKLGLRMPLLAGKGYGFTIPNPPQSPRLPALLIDGRLAVTPMVDGLRFVGTMELGVPATPTVNPARVEGMKRSIAEFYPAFRKLNFDSYPIWSGLRPCPPDGLPYIGQTRRFDNLIFATGHGMMGMSLGPVTGHLVGQIVSHESPSIPVELLSPDRYA